MEQELPTTPKNLGFLQVFIGVRVAQSLVFCLVLCGSLCDVKYVLFFNVTSLFIILSDNRIQQTAEQNAFCFFFQIHLKVCEVRIKYMIGVVLMS
jgi:hypothetical protein